MGCKGGVKGAGLTRVEPIRAGRLSNGPVLNQWFYKFRATLIGQLPSRFIRAPRNWLMLLFFLYHCYRVFHLFFIAAHSTAVIDQLWKPDCVFLKDELKWLQGNLFGCGSRLVWSANQTEPLLRGYLVLPEGVIIGWPVCGLWVSDRARVVIRVVPSNRRRSHRSLLRILRISGILIKMPRKPELIAEPPHGHSELVGRLFWRTRPFPIQPAGIRAAEWTGTAQRIPVKPINAFFSTVQRIKNSRNV